MKNDQEIFPAKCKHEGDTNKKLAFLSLDKLNGQKIGVEMAFRKYSHGWKGT